MRFSIGLVLILMTWNSTSNAIERDRFYLLLGTDVGYARVNTDIATEFDKNGYQINLKGLASYEWPRWILDGGFGWMYQYLTGSTPPVTSETITTKALLIEFAGRYRLGDSWQAGMLTRSIFGTDLEFGSRIDQANFAQLAGLQAAYEWNFSRVLIRATAQALTDLNISNRQIYLIEAGLEFGFAPRLNKVSLASSAQSGSAPEAVRIDLEAGTFYFEFASDRLTHEAEEFLLALGKFLNSHSGSWRELQIDGHTDQQGSEDYNLRLSRNRAEAVKAALIQAGASASRLSSNGFGFSRPRAIGNGKAVWKQNRRVELKFTGVSNPVEFRRALELLRQR